jgi:hypothetical protein
VNCGTEEKTGNKKKGHKENSKSAVYISSNILRNDCFIHPIQTGRYTRPPMHFPRVIRDRPASPFLITSKSISNDIPVTLLRSHTIERKTAVRDEAHGLPMKRCRMSNSLKRDWSFILGKGGEQKIMTPESRTTRRTLSAYCFVFAE